MSSVSKSTQFYSGFTPQSIPGCALWLDAADRSTLTLSGSNVTQWNDKSGNGRNLGVGSGTTTWSSTSNSINLNTSYMYVTSAVDLTYVNGFIVTNPTSTSNNQSVFVGRPNTAPSYGSTDGFAFYHDGQTSTRMYGTNANFPATNSISGSTKYIYSFIMTNTGVISIYINGTAATGRDTGSSRTNTAQGFSIGAEWTGSSYGNISSTSQIYEIIVYNGSTIPTSQRQTIEGYLARKWGLTSSLPATHLYKSLPLALRQFNPLDIGSCSLWLDAADPSTIDTTSTTVTAWRDKSGSGNNAVFDTNKPTYVSSNRYVETFNNNTHIRLPAAAFTNTTNQTSSFFIVYADKQEGTNNQGLFSTTDYWLYQLLRVPGFANFPYIIRGNITYTDANYVTFRNYLITTNPVLYFMQYETGVTNSTKYVVAPYGNAWNPTTNNTQSATGDIYLGGIDSFDVLGNIHANLKIYEVIVFRNITLTTQQRQQVEGYLGQKWGLRNNLPSTHPYKTLIT